MYKKRRLIIVKVPEFTRRIYAELIIETNALYPEESRFKSSEFHRNISNGIITLHLRYDRLGTRVFPKISYPHEFYGSDLENGQTIHPDRNSFYVKEATSEGINTVLCTSMENAERISNKINALIGIVKNYKYV